MQKKLFYDFKHLIGQGAPRLILAILIFLIGSMLIFNSFLEYFVGNKIYTVENVSDNPIVAELTELIHFYPDDVEVKSIKIINPLLGGIYDGRMSIRLKLANQPNRFEIINQIHYLRSETYISYHKTPLNLVWPYYIVRFDYGNALIATKTESPELYDKIQNLVHNVSQAGEPIPFDVKTAVAKFCIMLILCCLPLIRYRNLSIKHRNNKI